MWSFGSRKTAKEHPLLADHLNVPPKYTNNARGKSIGGGGTVRSNSNSTADSYKISDGMSPDNIHDHDMDEYEYPHDVLSDSELNAPRADPSLSADSYKISDGMSP